jgi:TetR/AcrR family transcriptional regulator, transcriptional repressor for nem operon
MSDSQDSRARLLSAAIDVIRIKGYAATRVDDIAAAAGVTKGSFFHHFATKEACARAAASYWRGQSEASFAASGHRDAASPAARVLAYIDFRISQLAGPVPSYTCYVGTVLHEVHDTHPELAADSAASVLAQAAALEDDLAAALAPERDAAHDLAVHIEATIQGALLIATAEGGNRGARASLVHLRRYLEIQLKDGKHD